MIDEYKKIVVLGAGLTGLTIAHELSSVFKNQLIVLEKENFLGGLATTLSNDGLAFDLGSHRLHKDFPKKIIRYIENLLGEKLLNRERKSVIYHQGRFLNYPPKLCNLLSKFSINEIANFLIDFFRNTPNIIKNKPPENFEEATVKRTGRLIYESFFHDYALKLWGLDPKEISPDALKKRKTVLNLRSFWEIFSFKNHFFYYPKNGTGEISKNLATSFKNKGGQIYLNTEIKKIVLVNKQIKEIIFKDQNGNEVTCPVLLLITTIPLEDFEKLIFPSDYHESSLQWRGLRTLFFLLDEALPFENETFYFCSQKTSFFRVSQISKYSPYLNRSSKGTFLSVEFLVTAGDKIWEKTEQELLADTIKDLIEVRILKKEPQITKYFSFKLPKVYPLYKKGWKENFTKIFKNLLEIENLFVLGRGGFFLHCNIDHSLIQGLELSKLIKKNNWQNKKMWRKMTEKFQAFSARD